MSDTIKKSIMHMLDQISGENELIRIHKFIQLIYIHKRKKLG